MIENHRRFTFCVLCGADLPLTAEPLFGKALARRIGERRPWSTTVRTADGTLETTQGGNPFLFTTCKCLCSASAGEASADASPQAFRDSRPDPRGAPAGCINHLSAQAAQPVGTGACRLDQAKRQQQVDVAPQPIDRHAAAPHRQTVAGELQQFELIRDEAKAQC